MFKKIVILIFLFTLSLYSQNSGQLNQTIHKPIIFPKGLMKYLPDSIRKEFPKIIEKAIKDNMPNEYLYTFLPDSISKLLPDSIDKFVPKLEDDMNQNRRLFIAKDLMSMKRIQDPQISPDGKWIIYTLKSPSIRGNKFYTDLYAVSIDGKKTKRLTTHGAADYNARWSPDGKKIAFISSRAKPAQIFVIDFPDGKPKKVSDMPFAVSNLAWSPNGKYFSFTSDVKLEKTVSENYPDYPRAKVRIFHNLPIRHWDEWTDENYTHLFVMPAKGGKAIDLMSNEKFETPLKPFDGAEDISWSPDSKEIAYACKKVPNYVESTNSDIYVVNIKTKKTKNITKGMMGFDLAPLYSPDGKWIAFNSMEHDGFESDKHRLMIYNRKSGEVIDLSKTFDNWIGETIWHPNSKSLYFTAGDNGVVKLFRVAVQDIKVGKKKLSRADWIVVADGWYIYGGGLGISKDGKTLFYGRQSMTEPMDLYTMSSDGGNQSQITDINRFILRQLKKIKIEEKWITSVDGAKVQSWVIYPPDFDSTKKYPLITYCQGGPQSMIGQRFHFRWNYYLMASHGYVMILPNRRGVPGFGQKWCNAISKDWGGLPMEDITSATDYMLKQPYIDKERSAAVGASAGGYAVFWLEGHNQSGRYKAFVSHCGVFNLESMYGATEELWFPNWEYGGPYWDSKNKENYDKNSPHRFAQNWNTPILIITGEHDFRVPYTQSLEAFTVAQTKGIDSELMIFPEETHFVVHPQEFVIWDSEFFNWIDKYCKKK